jgi:hypothetical protein
MSVVRNLMVRAGADFSKLKEEMKKAQTQVATFSTNVQSSLSRIGPQVMAAGTAASFMLGAAGVNDAIKAEAAIQVLSRTLGDSADDFMEWARTSGKALNMSQLQALDYGRTFAIMTKQFAKSQQEQFTFTTDLLKTAAVVAAGSGRTMQDTMERIASGMRGETDAIEDLGIMVGESTISQTEAFKKYAGDKSWAQLEENQKAQIRYFAILEQAANNYGTELLKNGGTAVQQFGSALANLKLAFGEAFLPIVNYVLPAMIRGIESFTEKLQYVIAFSRALFGYTAPAAQQANKQVQKTANSFATVGDNIKDANKAAKGALASFDEVNTLAEDTAQATSDTKDNTKVLDVQLPGVQGQSEFDAKMKSISESASSAADKVKEFWKWLTTPIDFSWIPALGEKLKGLIRIIAEMMLPPLPDLQKVQANAGIVIEAIKQKFESIGEFFKSTFGKVSEGMEQNREGISKKAADIFQAIKNVFIDPKTGITVWAINTFNRIRTAMEDKTLLENLKTAASGMWTSIKSAFTGAKEWFTKNVADPIGESIAKIKDKFKDGIGAGIKSVLNDFIDMLNGAMTDFNSFKNKFPLTNKIPDIPKIPRLARGGIVDSPTMAMVGESGKELIMPLENTGFVDKMASALGTAVLTAMQATGGTTNNRSGGDVVIKIDGNSIARAINPYLSKESTRVGSSVISIV